ncbi:type VI secretion system tube protein Hcp [Vibrio sp. JC009]|uniref:Hcp family type VI secretion system effector n=1 Tax=Vibrio sp. JC009 TaxID=2912314 RepID=UPI0023B093E4|nr:type VI secretion system tube protein Hcp [Vibrio sp. JC009]WED22949.1 type VI secretion system tube protein Hcp [Vibrio sp. JC009]
MALDMFLILDEIKGEAQDDVHGDTIDVLSWNWGMSQSGSFHSGGGGGAGKVTVQDITVTKWIDKSSPVLLKYCSNGDHFEEAKLIVRKAGKKPLEYLTISMKKVLIKAVSTGGSGGEDKLTENVTLHFKKVKVDYQAQDADGNKDGGAITYVWDIASNAEKE